MELTDCLPLLVFPQNPPADRSSDCLLSLAPGEDHITLTLPKLQAQMTKMPPHTKDKFAFFVSPSFCFFTATIPSHTFLHTGCGKFLVSASGCENLVNIFFYFFPLCLYV